jgi:hypothetical protein
MYVFIVLVLVTCNCRSGQPFSKHALFVCVCVGGGGSLMLCIVGNCLGKIRSDWGCYWGEAGRVAVRRIIKACEGTKAELHQFVDVRLAGLPCSCT